MTLTPGAGPSTQVRVGISACLLGQEVRFDGGHKRAEFLVHAVGPFSETSQRHFAKSVTWVPICPEVEAGFGTPRDAMHLRRVAGSIRLVTVGTGHDVTAPMDEFIRRRLPELRWEELSGYVLKKNSPSCGLENVEIHNQQGDVIESGRGLFAEALVRQFPLLPIEEEGRLSDPRLLEDFIQRVFAYHAVNPPEGGPHDVGGVRL